MSDDLKQQLIALQRQLNAATAKPTPAVASTTPSARPLHAEITIVSPDPPANVFDRMREIYAMAESVHRETIFALKVMTQNQATLPLPEMCDALLALRESAARFEDISKMLRAQMRTMQQIICMKHVANPLAENTIKCEHGYAKPEMKPRADLPTYAKEPEDYFALMAWLEIPENLWDQGKFLVEEGEFRTKVVDIDYLGFQDYLERMKLAGIEALPPGVKDVWYEATVKVTKKKDLL